MNVTIEVDTLRRCFALVSETWVASHPPSLPVTFVAPILDESGYHLLLCFDEPSATFFYELDQGFPLPENLHKVEHSGLSFYFGEHSRFCFIEEPSSGAKVLIAVHRSAVALNTWFDGPFDQVPPRLPLRPMIERAYPYVLEIGGIDEHGNFLQQDGQRVAISPYQDYVSGPELIRAASTLVGAPGSVAFFSKLVYESKRDWRPPSLPGPRTHTRDTSLAWPANHWHDSSQLWTDHRRDISTTWPPNHRASQSALTSPAHSRDGP